MTSDSASRVTRSSRNLRLAVLLFLGVLASVTALRAQEPSRTTGPTAAAEEGGTAKETAAGAPTPAAPAPSGKSPPAEDKAATPAASDRKPGTGAGAASPGRFEPTEKVRADFDVSFPVDI